MFADKYRPIQNDIKQYEGHNLYQFLLPAQNSTSINEAIVRWKLLVNEAQISDDPSEIEDITQYEIYRLGLKELMR